MANTQNWNTPTQDDFNWDEFESNAVNQNEIGAQIDERYEGTLTSIEEKEVIKGTVTAITKKEVIVSIGYKSEGIIPANEFRYNEDLKVGDEVEVFVESQEDKSGQLILSHKTARTKNAWTEINESLENSKIVKGFVKARTKGGLIVDLFGIEAFLPGSQADVKQIKDFDVFLNKTIELKVIKINQESKNVVVSHKAIIEAELEEQKKEIMAQLEVGQVLEGEVKNITNYGVFVDLGGVDGLIHITDLSHNRISNPEEVVEVGQKLNVVITKFETEGEKKRISLGLKQLEAHPWDTLPENIEVGAKILGKVVVVMDYGAFVEIAPGVEGLLHVSEMSWSPRLRSPNDFMKVGDEIEAAIIELDKESRKMSLSKKVLLPDPFDNIETKYPVGSKHKAIVRNFTAFGVFCELEEGIDGLLHISDLSWVKKYNHPSEFTKISDELDVQILSIDKENRQISIGHKQLEENPWDVFETIFAAGSEHEGTVEKIEGNNAFIALPYGNVGQCTVKQLRKEDGGKAAAEETLKFVVTEFNKDARRIVVSHTRTFDNKAASDVSPKASAGGGNSNQTYKPTEKAEKTTLGDLDVLANLRDKMNEDKKK